MIKMFDIIELDQELQQAREERLQEQEDNRRFVAYIASRKAAEAADKQRNIDIERLYHQYKDAYIISRITNYPMHQIQSTMDQIERHEERIAKMYEDMSTPRLNRGFYVGDSGYIATVQ